MELFLLHTLKIPKLEAVMDVVLQSNLILIRTNFRILNQQWMREFLTLHSQNMLILPRAVLIFKNQMFQKNREQFLETLSFFYAQMNDFEEEFFKKSLLKLSNIPIKIELVSEQEIQRVSVELYARDKFTVDISLFYPNAWIMSYLRNQFESYILEMTDSSIVLDVSHEKARARLERAINKRQLLHYEIQYRYHANFIERLYGSIEIFDDGEHEDEKIDRIIGFYSVLRCPVGASKDLLKQNYRQLARVYHPDRIYYERPNMVNFYTQKFQMIQEAYSVLKHVS